MFSRVTLAAHSDTACGEYLSESPGPSALQPYPWATKPGRRGDREYFLTMTQLLNHNIQGRYSAHGGTAILPTRRLERQLLIKLAWESIQTWCYHVSGQLK